MRMRGLIAALLLLAIPAGATAAEVRVDGGAVVYTAAAGETNRIRVGSGPTSVGESVFSDQTAQLTAVAPCMREDTFVRCPVGGVTVARFDLGDGADELLREGSETISGRDLPLMVAGGDGNDVIAGSALADVIDGGPGDDEITLGIGDDKAAGGPGNDSLHGSAGDDTLDGGEGDDEVTGGTGRDRLVAGTGRDLLGGNEDDDVLDLRNGERDTSGTDRVDCTAGSADTVALDPDDQILEWRQPNGAWFLVRSCERVEGQTAAPRPKSVGLFNPIGSRFRAIVDLNIALPATLTVEVFHRGRLVAKGSGRHSGPRTRLVLKATARWRRVKERSVTLTLRATVRDSAGRKSTRTRREFYTR